MDAIALMQRIVALEREGLAAIGAIFIINGELMHVEDGKSLEDATDCDLEAWGDTDPAPDIEALQRAQLLQLFTTDEVIAFEQEHCP